MSYRGWRAPGTCTGGAARRRGRPGNGGRAVKRRCRGRRARPAWLVLLLLGGCVPGGGLWSLVVPEQRHLQIRDPSQLPGVPIPPVPPPATVSRPAPPVTPKELSLDEAIRIALANSKVVRVLTGTAVGPSGQTIYDPAVSNTAIDEARAAFDPTLAVQNTWKRIDRPQGVLDPTDPAGARIVGFRTQEYDFNLDLSKKTVTGGTFKLDVADTVSHFDPGVFPLNPQAQSAVTLSYTQPLLKGASVAANVAPIVIAR